MTLFISLIAFNINNQRNAPSYTHSNSFHVLQSIETTYIGLSCGTHHFLHVCIQ